MAKRCDLCGRVMEEKEAEMEEELGREREICHDCLHSGYGRIGGILRRLKGKTRRTKDRIVTTEDKDEE